MKKVSISVFLPFILSFIFGTVSAQHSLQSSLNMFRAGDIIIKQQVEYKDPGRAGENVLWDFSQQDVVNEEYGLAYSSYDGNIITGMEHLTQYHYVLQNDSLLLWGLDNPTTLLRNRQPELLLQFPVSYGDTVGSYYYGHGKYGDRLELDMTGITETGADAYGMMILPDRDTLKHVLRTHTVKYIVEDIVPISDRYYEKLKAPTSLSPDSIDQRLATDSVFFVVETFRWYEKGYRYPVFETVRSWEQYRYLEDYEFFNTAFFYPPQDHYYLDDDEDNLAVLDEETTENSGTADLWEGLSYNIYPNPVKTAPLYLELYLPQATGLQLQLRNTMGLAVLNLDKGSQTAGICSFQVDMSGLPVGNYILNIQLDEKLISEIIMKR
jgi:hypothetical protein